MSTHERDQPESEPNRRTVLRAGLIGSAGLGLIASASGQAHGQKKTYGPGQTCPAWQMGFSQGSMGQTIYTYYCYEWDQNCMPILNTGSTRDSTTQLNTGCYGDCVGYAGGAPKAKTPPHVKGNMGTAQPAVIKKTDIPHQYNGNLESTGATDLTTVLSFPNCEIAYDVVHYFQAKDVYVRLVVAKFAVTVQFNGANAIVGYAVGAIGRQVAAPSYSVTNADPETGTQSPTGPHWIFRRTVHDPFIGDVGIHALLKP